MLYKKLKIKIQMW